MLLPSPNPQTPKIPKTRPALVMRLSRRRRRRAPSASGCSVAAGICAASVRVRRSAGHLWEGLFAGVRRGGRSCAGGVTQTEAVGAARGVRVDECPRPSALAAPGSLLHVLELVKQLNPANPAVLARLEPASSGPVIRRGGCGTDGDGSALTSVSIFEKDH